MPSDFEKDKEQELDRYGVWIKSGPQDMNDITGDSASSIEPPVKTQDLQENHPVSESPASVADSNKPVSGTETENALSSEDGVPDALDELDLPPLSDFDTLDDETELPVKDDELGEDDSGITEIREEETEKNTETSFPHEEKEPEAEPGDTFFSGETPHVNIIQESDSTTEEESLAELPENYGDTRNLEEQTISVENDWISDKDEGKVWETETAGSLPDLAETEETEPPADLDTRFPEAEDSYTEENGVAQGQKEDSTREAESAGNFETGFSPEDVPPVQEFETGDTAVEEVEISLDSSENTGINTEEIPVTGDSEFPDFSAFLNDSEISQINNIEAPAKTEKKEITEGGMEEISMDDFGLGDDFSEISLDDFMSDDSSSKATEKQAVFEDTPPLNIDLEFDDEFIEESKKMSRSQTDSDDLLSQFFDDDFGVEIIDESPDFSGPAKAVPKTEQGGKSDFDLSEIEGFDIFNDSPSAPASGEKEPESTVDSVENEGSTEEISLSDFDTEVSGSESLETVKTEKDNSGAEDVTSEFDDILSEIGPSANQGGQTVDRPAAGDINLTVTVEDDEESEEEPEVENPEEEEEEISVPIYIEETANAVENSRPNNAPAPGDFDLSEIEGFEFLDSGSSSTESSKETPDSEEALTAEPAFDEPFSQEEETITAEPAFDEPFSQEEETVTAEPAFDEPLPQEEENVTAEPAFDEPLPQEEETITAEPAFDEPFSQEEETITAEPAFDEPLPQEEETVTAEPAFDEPFSQEEETVTAEPAFDEPLHQEEETITAEPAFDEPLHQEEETITAEPAFDEPFSQEEETVTAEPAFDEPLPQEEETITAEPAFDEPFPQEEETITAEPAFDEPFSQEEETITAEPAFDEPLPQEEETITAEPAFDEPLHQEEETVTAEPAFDEPLPQEEETVTAEPAFDEPFSQEEETITAEPAFDEPFSQEEETVDEEPALQEMTDGETMETGITEPSDVSGMFLDSTGDTGDTSRSMKELDIPPALGEPHNEETGEANSPKLDITNPFDDSIVNSEINNDAEENKKVESEENMNNDFDDVKAVEQDLLDTETVDAENGPIQGETNEETTVLKKIADELSSIKDEITTLKSELNNLKSGDTVVSKEEEPPLNDGDGEDISIPDSQKESESSGFFTDDDTDESIALTGDELNNILTTADFTEETSEVEDEIPENEESTGGQDEKTEEVDEGISDFEKELLENDGKTFDEEKAFEDPAFEKVEPVPVTKIEDTNYLDSEEEALPAEELAIDEGEIPEIDFNDEVLVEPEETEITDTIKDLDINTSPEPESSPETAEPDTKKEDNGVFTEELKGEIKTVLAYMDQLLENLPESKIEEFAKSEHFHVYKKLFDELGLS